MPEYLAPGVYVEETSFGSKPIEGVATSTTGFVGMTRYGPVAYPGGPRSVEPRLVTSFAEFERVYSGVMPLDFDDDRTHLPYLPHAARAFFDNGGKRLYVSRVFRPKGAPGHEHWGVARIDLPVPGLAGRKAAWVARWPGAEGNVTVNTTVVRSGNVGFVHRVPGPGEPPDPLASRTWGVQARDVGPGALIEVWPAGTSALPAANAVLNGRRLHVVTVDADGRQRFVNVGRRPVSLPDDAVLLRVELRITVRHGNPAAPTRIDGYDALATSKEQKRFVGTVLDRDDPEGENAAVYLQWTDGGGFDPAWLALALHRASCVRLKGGHDGERASPDDLAGRAEGPDSADSRATGLAALAAIGEIAIVAAPDASALPGDACAIAAARLVAHAEGCRYRIAVLDGPKAASLSTIREFRRRFDSSYAALYYPWIEAPDPLAVSGPGRPQASLLLPPSGFVCGIYARSDIERGVHKAPANELVRGAVRFEVDIAKAQQDVLNPEGVNCLRFFEGRGNRVWGARTVSAEPEWRYVNVRRLLIFIEHSIDRGTQWAVFEPNDERLWAGVRRSVEAFLLGLWREGALLGPRPEDAFFVRCDRGTMTQGDLDNGRMICLIGVAPVRPAEFVILRIGQWTADACK